MLREKSSIKDLYFKLKANYISLLNRLREINVRIDKSDQAFKKLLKKYIALKKRYITLHSNSSHEAKAQLEKLEQTKYNIVIDQDKKILEISNQFLENIEMTEDEFAKSFYFELLFERYLPSADKESEIEPFNLPVLLKNYDALVNRNIHPFSYFNVTGRIMFDRNLNLNCYDLYFSDVTADVELNYIKNTDYLLTSLSVSNNKLKEAMKTIEMHKIMLIFMTSSLIQEYNKETSDHLQRIQEITSYLANECMKMDIIRINDYDQRQYVKDLIFTSVFHDIGKMGIPNDILVKENSLTNGEKEVIMNHTIIGASYIQKIIDFLKEKPGFSSYLKFLRIPYEICLYHHERWDGNGYPEKLKDGMIPISARIVGVADAYDAFRAKRTYHESKSHQDAVNMIKEESGRQFDPDVVNAFIKIAPSLEKIKYGN
jgi:HD-GYP domain-containing protein (c-di-GMP phosphodiesterase class II)